MTYVDDRVGDALKEMSKAQDRSVSKTIALILGAAVADNGGSERPPGEPPRPGATATASTKGEQ